MRKLLYITPRIDGTGGVQKFLSFRTKYLRIHYDYQIDILTTNAQSDATFFDFDHLNHIDVKIGGKGLFYLSNYIKLVKRQIADSKPDIIIIVDNGLKGCLLPKYIKTKQNRVIFEQHGHRFYRELESPDSLFYKFKNKFIDWLINHSMKKVDKLVAMVPAHKKEWDFKQIEVIPNPLPNDFFNLNKADYSPKKAIAVGRHSFEKGFDMLLEIWAEVVKDFPEWHLEIYGSSSSSIKLDNIVEKLNLEAHVSLEEPVEDIQDKYLASSVFLMSSRHEGFGNVLVEAMACGLPCIAFDCPSGPKYIMEADKTGFLIPTFDKKQYAEALKTLLANSALRRKMGQEGQQSISRFKPEIIMQKWDDLFTSLLA